MVYVNFETDERIGSYFETAVHADYLVSVLEKYYQTKVIPGDMKPMIRFLLSWQRIQRNSNTN